MSGKKTFHLGLTMAGAVSAGAYTGGVIDYLFEALENWEKAKKGELPGVDPDLVPDHKVQIDAMGGTSAGGMTTVMAALYAIEGRIKPVKHDAADTIGGERGNIFYDSWINLVDEPGKKTLEKALSNTDLDKHGQIYSILNSDFIDEIADKAFRINGNEETNPLSNLPSYVSDDLEMLVSHTMLRGIPLEVSFRNNFSSDSLMNAPSHVSYEHFLFSHFRLNKGIRPEQDMYFWLNPYDEKIREHMLMATIATGAFPAGLRYREFDSESFRKDYLQTVISRLIKGDMGETPPELRDKIDWNDPVLSRIINDYKSVTVDGGAINNEPYGEVLSILKKHHGASTIQINGHDYQKYGMIMIDPFPDFPEMRAHYKHPESLLEVAPKTLGTLMDQAKIKRRDMIAQFSDKSYRGVIFPVKYKPGSTSQKYTFPIASASLGAFGGFLDIRFRHHDFYLGRNNARNYLRAFLSMPYNPDKGIIHPIHKDWTDKMVKKFLIKMTDGSTFLPVIPDMNMILNDVNSADEAFTYSVPDIPKITEQDVKALEPHIRKRVEGLTSIVERKFLNDNGKKPKNVFKRLRRGFRNRAKKVAVKKLKGLIADKASEKTISHILENLKLHGLLK